MYGLPSGIYAQRPPQGKDGTKMTLGALHYSTFVVILAVSIDPRRSLVTSLLLLDLFWEIFYKKIHHGRVEVSYVPC